MKGVPFAVESIRLCYGRAQVLAAAICRGVDASSLDASLHAAPAAAASFDEGGGIIFAPSPCLLGRVRRLTNGRHRARYEDDPPPPSARG
jgi:hypothetical protein